MGGAFVSLALTDSEQDHGVLLFLLLCENKMLVFNGLSHPACYSLAQCSLCLLLVWNGQRMEFV